MEATDVYPNATPVLATNGLGGTLAAHDPDRIPLEPDLINDPRRRFAPGGSAVDAVGAMRLRVRNALGYAFLRPHHRDRLRRAQPRLRPTRMYDLNMEAAHFRINYRDFVPHDLMMEFLESECPPQEDIKHISKWQGNTIAGVDCGQDGHVVFYPTGHVLQQACAWYSKGDTEEDMPCSSTVIETGAVIRQFSVMGSKDAYHSTSAAKIYAAARGTTNCTIVAAPARVTPENVHKMEAKAKISFPTMISHIAGSPHAEAEVAFVTDGVVRWWEPEGGIQAADKPSLSWTDRIVRCEYSSHPRVLWTVNRVTVSTLDLREPPQQTTTMFDLKGAGAFATIYDVKRRARNPFQFVVGTGASVELLDSRMARQPLMSWIQPQSFSGETEVSFGAIDEVDLSENTSSGRGYVVSSYKRQKVTTLFPFERNRKRKRIKAIPLTPLRSAGDDEYTDTSRTSTEQYVASDATLDLRMEDGGEYTYLTGVCALRDYESPSASIYQLNNLGDLYSHRVSISRSQTKSYHAAVQPELPCGVTAQEPTDESFSSALPIPLDAILPEHDTESMQVFRTLPIKILRQQFPRLPEDRESLAKNESYEHDVIRHNSGKNDDINGNRRRTASVSDPRARNRERRRESRKDNDVEQSSTSTQSKDPEENNDGNAKAASGSKVANERLDDEEEIKTEEAEVPASDKTVSEFPEDKIAGKTKKAVIKSHARKLDADEFTEELLRVCNPTASLFRLHRYVLDELRIEVSSAKLLLFLRSSGKFRVRPVHHTLSADTYRVIDPSSPGADDVHYKKDDPRLAKCSCRCRPGSAESQDPCESWTCLVPHALIISSASTEFHLDDTAPSSAMEQEISEDFADIIKAAEAVYDDMNCESE